MWGIMLDAKVNIEKYWNASHPIFWEVSEKSVNNDITNAVWLQVKWD